MARLKITQLKSTIGRYPRHRKTIEALGLGKIRRTVVHEDSPQIRGMIRQVAYLLKVEEIE